MQRHPTHDLRPGLEPTQTPSKCGVINQSIYKHQQRQPSGFLHSQEGFTSSCTNNWLESLREVLSLPSFLLNHSPGIHHCVHTQDGSRGSEFVTYGVKHLKTWIVDDQVCAVFNV